MSGESKISNTEWGLVLGAAIMIDISQAVLEWMVIGLAINPFIDMFVGMSFALYLQLRGQSLANPKRLLGLIGAFVGELIPAVDELPLWSLDVVFNIVISKSDKILGQVPGGAAVAGAIGGGGNKSQVGANVKPSSPAPTPPTQNQGRVPLQSTNYPVAKPTETNTKPKTEFELENEKFQRMVARGNPGMRDTKVDDAMKLRKERAEVAERIGMDKDKAAKTILDSEKQDYDRGKAA